jgi:hypothetical protein
VNLFPVVVVSTRERTCHSWASVSEDKDGMCGSAMMNSGTSSDKYILASKVIQHKMKIIS